MQLHHITRLCLVSFSSFASLAFAVPEQKITAFDETELAFFGRSVCVSADVAIVGAFHHNDPVLGAGSGAVYIYRRSGESWTLDQKLTASDGAPFDEFGRSVAIDGDAAVVGAIGDNGTSGAAYVFRKSAGVWLEEAKLVPPVEDPGGEFGWSASMDGDVIIIGAELDDDLGIRSGSAYVFRHSGGSWIQEQKLTAADGAAEDRFGWSVSIDGDVAVVGSWGDDCTTGDACGAAYVYRYAGGTWSHEQKLAPSDIFANSLFGISVSVSGDAAIVGASNSSGRGAAYIFRLNGRTWTEVVKLTASDGATPDGFGHSVQLDGDTALVGALNDDCTSGTRCGSAYLFRKYGGTWTEEAKLTASDGAELDLFGQSVSVSGTAIIVGAGWNDDACPQNPNCDSGSAYFYVIADTAVPTASAWALLVMSLLVLVAGTIMFKWREFAAG